MLRRLERSREKQEPAEWSTVERICNWQSTELPPAMSEDFSSFQFEVVECFVDVDWSRLYSCSMTGAVIRALYIDVEYRKLDL